MRLNLEKVFFIWTKKVFEGWEDTVKSDLVGWYSIGQFNHHGTHLYTILIFHKRNLQIYEKKSISRMQNRINQKRFST
ncbi:hypothetical protein CN378_10445 [Bacillus sp. AFS015802]|nr:hypothetical protein CN378_10445 [Bacillus sp. AFS015802]